MFDTVPYTYIPVLAEPDTQARFREELANERPAAPSPAADMAAVAVDADLLRAGYIALLGRIVRFS
jgi:hypothetical protein